MRRSVFDGRGAGPFFGKLWNSCGNGTCYHHPQVILLRAVDCASAGVTDAKNLARILLIRQELSDKFLERGDVKNKNSSPLLGGMRVPRP
jgi:hypothetical protein